MTCCLWLLKIKQNTIHLLHTNHKFTQFKHKWQWLNNLMECIWSFIQNKRIKGKEDQYLKLNEINKYLQYFVIL